MYTYVYIYICRLSISQLLIDKVSRGCEGSFNFYAIDLYF